MVYSIPQPRGNYTLKLNSPFNRIFRNSLENLYKKGLDNFSVICYNIGVIKESNLYYNMVYSIPQPRGNYTHNK